MSIFTRFKSGLKKTSGQIAAVFTGNRIDEAFWDELYERLVLADMGAELSEKLLSAVKKDRQAMKTPETLVAALIKETAALFPPQKNIATEKPKITLVIGVNGAGKTTTIAKLTTIHKSAGRSVLLCAADTFRAAAIEQLKNWADRLSAPIITPPEGSDPAAAAYEAVLKGKKLDLDEVIIDTAGRLHTNHNLVEEMKKVHRVIDKAKSGAPEEVLLVLDGTAGQNALHQAKAFSAAVPVTGLIVTKLDGTAKGGIVVRVASELNLPVLYVGLGEKADDLVPFDAEAYAGGLFSA